MILGILQARMSSSRLPGKVLKDVHGMPMIIRQLDRISRAKQIDQLVVATSHDPSDDQLVKVLIDYGIEVRRGPLNDVSQRFAEVIEEFRPEHFVRLTADCPLTDPEVIDYAIQSHLETGADYSSNGITRTFQHGLDVEVIRAETFKKVLLQDLTPEEREHVTMAIYNRYGEFSINQVTQLEDASDLRWTVDEPEDLLFVQFVYDSIFDSLPEFTTKDVMNFLSDHPEHSRTSGQYLQELEARS